MFTNYTYSLQPVAPTTLAVPEIDMSKLFGGGIPLTPTVMKSKSRGTNDPESFRGSGCSTISILIGSLDILYN